MPTPSVTTKPAREHTSENDWAVRSDYWLKKLNPVPQYQARKRRKIQKPLVLSGHGIRLKVEADTLLITCGFTHYPQPREKYRLFPGDRQLPSRIVILDGDGSITIDALEWLSRQGVPLVQIDWCGDISGVGGATYAANPAIAKRQIAMQTNSKGFDFAKTLITYVQDRPGHDRRYAIDSAKLMRNLGWAPEHRFEDGIVKTVQWYLDHPDWVERARSGEYRNYYRRQYGVE